MAARVTPLPKHSWNPLRCTGTALSEPLLLMAKLIVLAQLLTFQWRAIPDPYLPFLSIFDRIGPTPLFRWGLKSAFLLAALAVLLNRWVRTACLLIGLVYLTAILSSRPYHTSNQLYVGCIMFLLGLYEPGRQPWLIRLQLAMVYFGGGLNKLLDVDWRTGQFFEFWARYYIPLRAYFRVASWFPPMVFSRLLSWGIIVCELGLSVGILIRRVLPVAIWIGVLLHTGMYLVTSRTFGTFFYTLLASYLAFVPWPQSRLTVLYDGDCGFCTRTKNLFEKFDLEGRFDWVPFQRARDLHGISEEDLRRRMYVVGLGKIYSGFAAFQMMLLCNPLFYFVFLPLIAIPHRFLIPYSGFFAMFVFLVFSPLFAPIGEVAYNLVARNRHRLSTAASCRVD